MHRPNVKERCLFMPYTEGFIQSLDCLVVLSAKRGSFVSPSVMNKLVSMWVGGKTVLGSSKCRRLHLVIHDTGNRSFSDLEITSDLPRNLALTSFTRCWQHFKLLFCSICVPASWTVCEKLENVQRNAAETGFNLYLVWVINVRRRDSGW
jgi:hypothetical protein